MIFNNNIFYIKKSIKIKRWIKIKYKIDYELNNQKTSFNKKIHLNLEQIKFQKNKR